MQFKKLVSCSTAFVIALLSVFTGLFNCPAGDAKAASLDYDALFNYKYDGSDSYIITAAENFFELLGDNTAVEIPNTYDDKEHGEFPVKFTDESIIDPEGKIKELTLPDSCSNATSGLVYELKGLEKVVFPYGGSDFDMSQFAASRSDGLTTLKDVYIYAVGLSLDFSANAFMYIAQEENGEARSDFKVHVINEAVKNAIIAATATSKKQGKVVESQIEYIQTGKKKSSLVISCEDITYGTEGGFKPKVESQEGDGEIAYYLYRDAAATDQLGTPYNSSSLQIGTYYIKGIMGSTEDYDGCESNVVKVEVKGHEDTDKDDLNAAIEAAEEFYEENRSDQVNFDATAWNAVYGQTGALAKAQYIAEDKKGSYSQEQIDEATQNLLDALETLKKSTADTTEAWNTLQELIRKAEAIVARAESGEIVYTEASYSNLTREINEAKDLDQDTATMREIERISHLLQSAIEGLKVHNEEVPAGKPFAYVNKGGKETLVLSMTAPDPMAGAKKIKVTFDCAEDVHFNENATIDITALVAGTKSYQKFKGNNYTAGGTNAVELPLEAEIKAGDSVELAAATWSWDNAKDYVYGITKLEFMDAEGRILYTVIDQDIARENLASAIKDAEEIDTSAYTEESVAKLTKALEDAKALKNDATVEEINQAIAAINDAINGLVKKTDDKKPGDDPGQPGDETPGGNNNQDDPQVIGAAQGKVFTAGNFQYKVTAAATITAVSQKKTAGKVTVVGLSKAGKKKSSISVKDTVSVSGATYHVTAIGNKAFQKAPKLKKATLGTNIKAIPTSAFDGCKKLTAVSAAGVTKIEKSAFKGCKALKKLTLKKKLASAKKGAFKGCKKTIKVTGGSKKVNKANVTKLKKAGYKKFK